MCETLCRVSRACHGFFYFLLLVIKILFTRYRSELIKTHTMKATNIQKSFKITLEMTEEEVRNLLFSLEDYNGYGTVEELIPILKEVLTSKPEEDEEEEKNNPNKV